MDHKKALQLGLTERYLLGELTPSLRDEFEEHFFDCELCAADVQAGAMLIDNTRAVLKAAEPFPATKIPYNKFGLPFQSAALLSIFLAVALGYQNIVSVPHREGPASGRVPEIVQDLSLVGTGARAKAQARAISAGNDAGITIEIPGTPDFVAYELRILDPQKNVKYLLPVSAEQVKQPVLFSIPAGFLSPGSYAIAATGKKADGTTQVLDSEPISVK